MHYYYFQMNDLIWNAKGLASVPLFNSCTSRFNFQTLKKVCQEKKVWLWMLCLAPLLLLMLLQHQEICAF